VTAESGDEAALLRSLEWEPTPEDLINRVWFQLIGEGLDSEQIRHDARYRDAYVQYTVAARNDSYMRYQDYVKSRQMERQESLRKATEEEGKGA
jgi:hypothetical protein